VTIAVLDPLASQAYSRRFVASTDKTPVVAEAEPGPIPQEQLLEFLERMIEIRVFEEETQRLFTQNLVRGSTHLCSGQEAVVVGACSALREGESMLCTYRGHGAVLAMGAPLDRAFGEILGKAEGLCGGKGGSMHLTDVSVGAYGSVAIVGAQLPIAVGLGFAGRYSGTNDVCLCFFGDGAANIGAFHEALNLASIWKLPVLFVCENNLYGEYTAMRYTTPIERIADRASSYGMPGVKVDGNDVGAVYRTVAEAAGRAHAGEGPTLIEALTYRHKGHSRGDPGKYRPQEEVAAWLARDPIALAEAELLERGVNQSALDEVRRRSEANVRAAVQRARSWDEPALESRLEGVWA
jgi:acetoin:2,6-dichlorophenolindophenol oxidoreductase subunit alpha